MQKLVTDIKEAIIRCGLKDGMCIGFHHHLRGGDYVLNMVMDEIAKLGIKDITINASSIHDGHLPLIEHMKKGVVTGLVTAYIGPAVGKAISEGILKRPVVFQTHGYRPCGMEKGEYVPDIAFIAAPTSDPMGNCTGKTGKSACGSLGYAFTDARYAKKTVIITDNLVEYPLAEYSISEVDIDYVVCVDEIGNPEGIVSGTTKLPRNPVSLKIARYAAKAIEASGLLKDGFSFQTGAGGASLAAAGYLKEIMLNKGIKGSYALGGITGYLVDMLNTGCFKALQDVQCFDLKAVESIRENPNHMEISASHYANPMAKSSAASSLDVVVLGATEIDINFNVNVHTDSNGYIIGGSGGHSDVAQCAKMTVIVAPLLRTRHAVIKNKVKCISTPGNTVDILVTEYGISVNPVRKEWEALFKKKGVPIVDIYDLQKKAEKLTGIPEEVNRKNNKVVAEVVYRDGTILDKIYQV
ncbi:citrate lyase subunit alpha [Mediterraneibacter sp. NSJ-55]|uniref:Citrate lyase alpha chain n=1 Tax=Mediterraneibacter hominis TaxID=2763054 RepID=A0A923LJU3_9FIRM|nr:citrate lyase subunit alpha [Mediterraneibacter hominis]MBC5689600.1 citrate lyase subunit alpha [Mediterraneibacter hominis]